VCSTQHDDALSHVPRECSPDGLRCLRRRLLGHSMLDRADQVEEMIAESSAALARQRAEPPIAAERTYLVAGRR
jgi:hypothetical protein